MKLAQKADFKNIGNAGLGGEGGPASEMLGQGRTLLSRAAATASMFLIVMLVLVPCAALFFALNPLSISSSPHLRLFQLPAIYGAVWALISAVGGIELIKVVTRAWHACGSSRLLWRLGFAAWRAEHWSFAPDCYAAYFAVNSIKPRLVHYSV